MTQQNAFAASAAAPARRIGSLLTQESAHALKLTTLEGESVTWSKGGDLLDNFNLIAVVLDLEARVVYCSNHLLELTGWQSEEVLGQDWFDLFIPREAHGVPEVFASLIQNTPLSPSHESDILTRAGNRRWVRWHSSELRTASGKRIGTASVGEDLTDVRRINSQLRETKWWFRQVARNIREVLFLDDVRSGRTLYMSPAYEDVWGRTCESACAQPFGWMEAVHPDDLPRMTAAIHVDRHTDARFVEHEFRIIRPNGEIRWIHTRVFPIRDGDGAIYRIAGLSEDITDQREQQHKIARLSRIYAVLSGINSAIVRIRDRRQLLDEACRIAVVDGAFRMAWIAMLDRESSDCSVVASYGAPKEYLQSIKLTTREGLPHSSVPGSRALRDMKPVWCNDIAVEPTLAERRHMLAEHDIRAGVSLPLIVDGRAIAVLSLFSNEVNFFDEQEHKLLGELAGDIAFGLEYIEKEERAHFLAYYDALTGLPNSTLFHDLLSQRLQSAADQQSYVSVLLLDLERFSQINETSGRHVGDTVLRMLTARLRDVCHEPHVLARISADTFAIAICHAAQDPEATAVRERIFAALTIPMAVENEELQLTAKSGIARYPADGADAAALFRNAEAALSKAQHSSQSCVFYAPSINAETTRRRQLEIKLRKAVEQQQFVLHYQPKVSAKHGRIVGLEALIRWNDPETGVVPPGVFIGALEESGLILDVGRWAIDQALRDHQRWSAAGLQPPRIAVNVSAVQLRKPGFVDVVRRAIDSSGATADALELEITESVIIEDIETNTGALQEIGELGVSLAIDDFGTGYSSLRYLAKLPADCLKIDRSFIATMLDDPNSMTIVSTIISLAHALNLHVVAEGVETKEQSKFLKLMRCDEMQGFLFHKPLPADACEALLRNQSEALATGSFRRHRAART